METSPLPLKRLQILTHIGTCSHEKVKVLEPVTHTCVTVNPFISQPREAWCHYCREFGSQTVNTWRLHMSEKFSIGTINHKQIPVLTIEVRENRGSNPDLIRGMKYTTGRFCYSKNCQSTEIWASWSIIDWSTVVFVPFENISLIGSHQVRRRVGLKLIFIIYCLCTHCSKLLNYRAKGV